LTDTVRKLGNKFAVKVICTNDSHYTKREEAELQRILLCRNLNKTLEEAKSESKESSKKKKRASKEAPTEDESQSGESAT
jgi:DNA polymerase III alpha subunit